ncbi:hypothetical protein [Pseudomonas citronellolis]|uniref:hypothetical protein n=1 Tax=Pseudomonas citronellolis TaxID=53408 RepID=UPI001065EF80|nr:hypothetical protein [Pseudomonas humi]
MELLLVIVAVAAFLLLVKYAKANGRISERTSTSRLGRTRLQTSNAKVSDCAAICRCNSRNCSASSPSTTSKLKLSACESKREEQRDDLAQGARNRLEKAEEKLQSAMAEANRIVGMANEWVQEIAGDEEPHRGGGGATATPSPYSRRCSVQSA